MTIPVLEEVLVSEFDAYRVNPTLFSSESVTNDEQLPFEPNVAWSISNPAILKKISLIDPVAALKDKESMFLDFGIDEYRSVLTSEATDLVYRLIALQCRLGLRICILGCATDDKLVGYRVIGASNDLSDLLEKSLSSPLIERPLDSD